MEMNSSCKAFCLTLYLLIQTLTPTGAYGEKPITPTWWSSTNETFSSARLLIQTVSRGRCIRISGDRVESAGKSDHSDQQLYLGLLIHPHESAVRNTSWDDIFERHRPQGENEFERNKESETTIAISVVPFISTIKNNEMHDRRYLYPYNVSSVDIDRFNSYLRSCNRDHQNIAVIAVHVDLSAFIHLSSSSPQP